MSTDQFTPEEIEKMRSIVLASDQKRVPNTFDPNNPPKVRYTHQEFPKLVYDHDASKPSSEKLVVKLGVEQVEHIPAKYVTKVVHNKAELEQALAGGWKEDAPDLASQHQAVDAAAEPEESEEELLEPGEEAPPVPKKRGRKSKAEQE